MNAFSQYQTYQVDTSAPEDRVALLYDGARRFVDRALSALEKKHYDEVSQNVGKAQSIFAELQATLNFEAGEIASNLEKLYDYWAWRLSQGLIRKDVAAFAEVSAHLIDLHGAWMDAARQVRSQRGTGANVVR